MLELLLFMVGYWAVFLVFLSWKTEQRKRALDYSLVDDSDSENTRLSRRYQDSSVFETVLGSSPSQDFLSFHSFVDKFQSFGDVTRALRKCGFHGCHLIVGVDFTASNEWQGRKTFNKNSLHTILLRGALNPYQRVITTLGETLEPLRPDRGPCRGFQEVLQRYTELARSIVPAGPTSFAPIIRSAAEIVRKSGGKYHILVLISDGQMGEDAQTVQALVEACAHPMSIILVGVGDGPWERMEEYDDLLPMRKFDNFQFVDYGKATNGGKRKNAQAAFALHALMEIPDQYKAIRHLGYIG